MTSTHVPLDIDLSYILLEWVEAGLSLFSLQHLSLDDDASEELEKQLLLLNIEDFATWLEFSEVFSSHLANSEEPVGRLTRLLGLSMPELFMLALCGAVESRISTGLLIARLQQNEDNLRPQLHLVQALLRALFPESHVVIGKSPLFQHKLLYLDGEQPLSWREVRANTDCWSALYTDQLPEGCLLWKQKNKQTEKMDTAVVAELQAWYQTEHVKALVLHKSLEQLDHLIAHIQVLSKVKTIVQMPSAIWQRHEWRLIANACNWLLLSDLRGSNTLPALNTQDALSIIATSTGTALPKAYYLYTQAQAGNQTRAACWLPWVKAETVANTIAAARIDLPLIPTLAAQASQLAQGKPDLSHIREIRAQNGTDKIRQIANEITTHVTADMLILPEQVETQLQRLKTRCLRREQIQQRLGSPVQATATSGVRCLFHGVSGTGKTYAASWLASELGSPLFRLDLAQVMNKYIGETEKNLSLALDAAAETDVILLFDEADALFSKRTSDTRHDGDRFGNTLTNFLLMRIEEHPGIVLLTTNAHERIDPAFRRRIDTAIEFRKPDYAERYRLWQLLLGELAPTDDVLMNIAAYCELPAGNIRNIVLNAAAWCEEGAETVPLTLLLEALQDEYRKLAQTPSAELMNMMNSAFK